MTQNTKPAYINVTLQNGRRAVVFSAWIAAIEEVPDLSEPYCQTAIHLGTADEPLLVRETLERVTDSLGVYPEKGR